LADVAAAVDLREGPAGVRTLLREVARREPVSVRDLARAVGLPVPVVSAVCAELRTRGVISDERPTRLTSGARAEVGTSAGPDVGLCPTCDGIGHVIPDDLWPIVERQAAAEAASPAVRVDLDQAHCTPQTAIRRALLLADAGVLEGGRTLLLGDDDLLSIAIDSVAAHLGLPGPDLIVVLDVDPDLTSFLTSFRSSSSSPFDARIHDLREPLPDDLVTRFDTVVTDPPYTAAGARLFGSRAADALGGRPGGDLFFSFGSTTPDVVASAQADLVAMGFAIRSLVPDFNEYVGTGALAGTSAMYHLRSARSPTPAIEGRYDGPLYTSEGRDRPRTYTCQGCGRQYLVGPGRRYQTVTALQAAGCECGEGVFEPGPRVDHPVTAQGSNSDAADEAGQPPEL
jgi:predicted methyltransferase